MNVTEIKGVFHCDCGFSWRRGTSGRHNCADGLRAKLASVVAENTASRNAVQVFCDVVGTNVEVICDEVGQDGVKAILSAIQVIGNMPNTDAYMAEVRASAVEAFAYNQAKIADEEIAGGNIDLSLRYRGMSHAAIEFATQLRKGSSHE